MPEVRAQNGARPEGVEYMRSFRLAAIGLLAVGLTSCMAPVGPVEVTRFHQPEALQRLGQGTIAIEAAAGLDPASLELQTYRTAVARELEKLGYQAVEAGGGTQVALVRLRRGTALPAETRGPVSVGVGGSTGSFGSGVGLGIGIDLSGKPAEQVMTELGVMIQDRASGTTLWEGRASFSVSAKSPLAEAPLGASKMAEALFADFPGNNGETVEVR
jgi:hypothetical protein